jgi:hypothetical protein
MALFLRRNYLMQLLIQEFPFSMSSDVRKILNSWKLILNNLKKYLSKHKFSTLVLKEVNI